MTKSQVQFYGPFIAIILIIIGWVVLFQYFSPTDIVNKIGIQNAYVVTFLLAVFCGFSSITGSTFYIAVAALAVGGAHPLVLGLVGGVGLCISDFAFYYVVCKGTHVIDKHWVKFSDFIKRLINRTPDWFMYCFVFLYSGFFPVPNDVLLVTLAVGKTRFQKIAPYLFAGDVVSVLLLTYISH